ncbi:MAG: 3',5'-nucleoside bisphosphate phosphatase [Rubrivivax sp.]
MQSIQLPINQLTNADLHSHSTVSDGTLTPEAVAALAHAQGVELWALTDHDELSGQQRARDAALALGMDYLCGVEISVSFAGETVHIVGLGVDPDDADLLSGLATTRSGRRGRALRMSEGLAAAGLAGTYEGALRHVSNPDLISRSHFARHLVERGVCGGMHEVFRHYLTEGKPGYVPHEWARLKDAVRWISGAGGIAVIAHPARYRFSPSAELALFTEFIAHGGRGVEVMTGSHSAAEQLRYAETALEFGLLASRGSDFHDPEESRTRLGSVPDLPGRLTPVWEALVDRIQRPVVSSVSTALR